jgi:hypothetical protein
MVMLVLLERLTPTERAVYVPREAFAYAIGRSPRSGPDRGQLPSAVPTGGTAGE